MVALSSDFRKLWQFCGVGALSALVLPVKYIYGFHPGRIKTLASSQPHADGHSVRREGNRLNTH